VKGVAIALLAGVAAVAGLGHAASAADLAIPPPPPPPPSWTGFYVGVHGGAAWQSNSDWSFTDTNPVTPGGGGGFFVPGTQTLPNVGSNAALGGVGGLQAGYNWQFAPAWVAGIEGDFSWASLSDHRTISPTLITGVLTFPQVSTSMTTTTQWLSTIRGRLGFVGWWNTMFYATGGAAWQNIDYSAQTTIGPGVFNPVLGLGALQSNFTHNTTKTGWVVGAGAEWMATTNILLRVEYLYYGIDSGTTGSAQLVPIANFFNGPTAQPFNYNWTRENIQVFRVAGSYKF
jgi:outer membrane immunogenic protein